MHAGHCYAIGKRRRPVSRDEARRLLTAGLRACTHCTQTGGRSQDGARARHPRRSHGRYLVPQCQRPLLRSCRRERPWCSWGSRSPHFIAIIA
ncbi:DUF6233 domain-containing protein [Streptomyces sp. NPDC002701]|uniref:DUF6233 domain-containing protein n=1 Tax=Streptomyces sp. NPDC002701 TaxID=3364661 RepID=UPI0036C729FB